MSAGASRNNLELKTGPSLAEAAERASLVIRDLRSRLAPRTPEPPIEETPDQLERQLARYFAEKVPQNGPLDDLRTRVIDGIVDRLVQQWEKGSALESEVVERLVRRVLERIEP